jgi:RHS repeat-associated protein
MACAVFVATLAGVFAATAAQATTTAVGAIAGASGVGATGAATYSIPISLPPGTNGMQPSVALVYNSQSGDGLAGYGWTLSGLSTISRCPWAIDEVGQTRAVQFAGPGSQSDVFCLDGQYLALKSGSTYGADGAVYSTQVEGFSKIVSHGSSNNGPGWFTVQSKDGRLYEYGNTADSQIGAQGTNPAIIRVWALDRVTDLNGNYYTITYQNNSSTTGEYWPLSINYTGNGSTTPDHQVVFGYTPRPAGTVQTSFVHGSLITNSQLLSVIKVVYVPNPNPATFTFNLAYSQDPANGRNQLTSVQECGRDGSCLLSTNIGWESAQAGWQGDTGTGVFFSTDAYFGAAHLIDVDGDGIDDLVYPNAVNGGSTIDWFVMFGKPGGGFIAPVDTGISTSWDYYDYAVPFNYDGSGKTALLVPLSRGSWGILAPTGSRTPGLGGIFTTPGNNLSMAGSTPGNTQAYQGFVWTMDYYGRGLDDIAYTPDGVNLYVVKNLGPGSGVNHFAAPQFVFGFQNSVINYTFFVSGLTSAGTQVDFDGSGKGGVAVQIVAPSGSGYEWPTYIPGFASPGQVPPALSLMGTAGGLTGLGTAIPMDANGDGMTDLLWTCMSASTAPYACQNPPVSDQAWWISVSTGAGFVQMPVGTAFGSGPQPRVIMVDYYASGHQEAMVQPSSGNSQLIQVNYTQGSGFSASSANLSSTPNPGGFAPVLVGSIEANGLSDLVYPSYNASLGNYEWHYNLHATGVDLVTSITGGLGNVSQFQYTSLAWGSPIYTNGSSAQYPIKDIQSTMQVVSKLIESDGTGGNDMLNYTYSGAKFDSWGRGFLGFASRTINDNFRNTTETISYSQTFPWTDMVTSDAFSTNAGVKISDIENTGADELSVPPTTYNATYFPFFDTSTTTTYNYNGTTNQAVRTVTTTLNQSDFDAYGNITSQQTTTVDGATGASFIANQTTIYASPNTSTYCADLTQQLTLQRTSPAGSMGRIASTPTSDLDTSNCRLNSQTTASGQTGDGSSPLTKQYQFDAFGNIRETDISGSGVSPSPRTTKFDFTGGNNEFPTTTTYVVSPILSLVTHASWNYDLGLKASDTDANTNKTSYVYDGFGRIISVTRPDKTTILYTYAWCTAPTRGVACPTGNGYEVTTTQIANDGITAITTGYTVYDMKGRPVRQGTVLLGGVTSLVDTTYDSVGHVLSVARPYLSGQTPGFKAVYTYDDAFDRVTGVTEPADSNDPSGDVTSLGYNLLSGTGYALTASRQITIIGAQTTTQTTTKYTDALGEVVEIVDANNGRTLYTFDAFGDLTKTTDADGNATNLVYDGLGHKTAMTDPDMGHWTYQLDALGEILCQTDANNQSIIETYDGMGRITSKRATAPGGGCNATAGTSSSLTYDQAGALGLLASVSDTNGFQRAYAYDTLERPIDVTTTVGGTPYDVSTAYDNFGRIQTVTYPVSVTPSALSSLTITGVTASPASLTMGGMVTLSGSATDSSGLLMTYDWTQSGPATMSLADPDKPQTTFIATAPGNFTFSLTASDENAASTPASTAIVTVAPPAPDVPTVPATDSHQVGITVNWAAANLGSAAGPISYVVQETLPNGSTTQTPVSSNSASFTLSSDGTYAFAVSTCANNVCSALSATSSYTTYLAPSVPQSLSAPSSVTSNVSPATYTVGWTKPSFAPSSGVVYTLQEKNTLNSGDTFATDYTGAGTSYNPSETQDGNYVYQLQACNANPASNNVCSPSVQSGTVAVTLPPTPPGTISFTPATDDHSGNWEVMWGASSVNINCASCITYYMQEKLGTNGSFKPPTSYTANNAGLPSNSGYLLGHTANGTYYYQVKACAFDKDTGGTACTPYGAVSAGYSVIIAPPSPTNLAHTTVNWDGSFSVTMSENAGSIAVTYYEVQLGEHDGETNTDIWGDADCTSATTSCAFSSLTPMKYIYETRACDTSVACSNWTPLIAPYPSVNVTVLSPPAAPTGLGVSPSPSTNGSYTLSWIAPTTGTVTYYAVYGSTGGAYSQIATPGGTSYALSGKGSGSYWYYILACNQAGCSGGSNTVGETVYLPPATPDLSASSYSINVGQSVTLSWSTPPGPVTNYVLQREYTAGWIGVYSGTATSFTQTLNGIPDYYYQVKACNGPACSGWSATVDIFVQSLGGCGKNCYAPVNPATAPTPSKTAPPASPPPPAAGPMAVNDPMLRAKPADSAPQATMLAHADGSAQPWVEKGALSGIDHAFHDGTTLTTRAGTEDNMDGLSRTTARADSRVRQAQVDASGAQPRALTAMVGGSAPRAMPTGAAIASLAEGRQTLLGKRLRQPSEAVMQALADRRSEETLPSILPPATASDLAAWNASSKQQDSAGPDYAPPVYIAYGEARMAPVTSSPYRFAVTYAYDPASGALMAVQNAQTGFDYWQASMGNGGNAPVDAFGHVLAYTDGNNVSTVLAYDQATGLITGISSGVGQSSSVQQLAYTWGALGNLQQRCDANRGLTENFTYDSVNRLKTSNVSTGGSPGSCTAATAGASISVSYDAIGNIQTLSNSGVTNLGGTYSYDPNHPHGVSTVGNIPGTYTYDANGNMLSGNGRTITWNADNLPVSISGTSAVNGEGTVTGSSTFSYGPDFQRYLQTATVSGNTTTTTYVGKLFEVVSTSSGTQYRHNIIAPGGVVAVHTLDQSGNATTNYLHSDHLGSVDTITSNQGVVTQQMSFDALGIRRDPANWAYDLSPSQISLFSGAVEFGYTKQENLDNVGLVHMNGRVYDPTIGRFLSADPRIQDPYNGQSFNRYTYVYNNPLTMTDPSGFDGANPTPGQSPDDGSLACAYDGPCNSGLDSVSNGNDSSATGCGNNCPIKFAGPDGGQYTCANCAQGIDLPKTAQLGSIEVTAADMDIGTTLTPIVATSNVPQSTLQPIPDPSSSSGPTANVGTVIVSLSNNVTIGGIGNANSQLGTDLTFTDKYLVGSGAWRGANGNLYKIGMYYGNQHGWTAAQAMRASQYAARAGKFSVASGLLVSGIQYYGDMQQGNTLRAIRDSVDVGMSGAAYYFPEGTIAAGVWFGNEMLYDAGAFDNYDNLNPQVTESMSFPP